MKRGASTMVAAGLGLIGLVQLLPVAEQGLPGGALAALSLAAPAFTLLLAVHLRHVALTHAAFPLSFLPLAAVAPSLYTGPDWSGPGGLLTLVGALAAFGVFLTAAPLAPRVAAPLRGPPRERLLLALTLLALAGPVVALWWPILAASAGPSAVLFGAVATVALITVHTAAVTRGDLVVAFVEPSAGRFAEGELQASLSRRRSRIAVGLAFASLTLVAGLLWYLRRGFG